MRILKPTGLIVAAAGIALCSGIASAASLRGEGIQPRGNPALVLAQSGGLDLRPAQQLSDAELQNRMVQWVDMLQRGEQPAGVSLQKMMREDRVELQRRSRGDRAVAPSRQPDQPDTVERRTLKSLQAQENADRVRPRRPEPPAAQPRQPQQPQQPQVPQRIDRVERVQPSIPRGDSVAEAAARDGRPSQALTDAELRQRISRLAGIAQVARLDRNTARRLQQIMSGDQAELDRRIQDATGVDVNRFDANDEARRLLEDQRPASRLGEAQLRERIQQARAVLATGAVGPRLETRLRDRLTQDSDQLRSMVASAAGQRLDFGNDRSAARDELRRAQRERRRDLDNPRNRIVIDTRRRGPAIGNIPLAEARDIQIEEQLTAPPLRNIERRFTLEEYRRNPSLRSLMPGVEIDTVRFGFNEDFLRETEILKLDRIGAIIERIVAGNRDEVFLIEGHTDLVGSDAYNENLSFRRAAAVRDALLQYFYIEPHNLEIIGYGEQFPRIPVEYDEPENRRATLRRITPVVMGRR